MMKIVLALVFLILSQQAFAKVSSVTITKEQGSTVSTYLRNHEPNLLGLRYDSDEKDIYLDFKISLQYPLFKETFDSLAQAAWVPKFVKSLCKNKFFDDCYPYLSFTGRFSQYINALGYGRESSPVIGRRFNPKLFWRFENNKRGYIDFEYAHESNGQYISSKESIDALADDLANRENGKPIHAYDYISRGWDYYGITAKYIPAEIGDRHLTLYLSLAKYIGGLLQGTKEEYFAEWEAPRDITQRQQINGFRLMAKWKEDQKYNSWFKGYKIVTIFETGTVDFGKYNTYQLELSTRIRDMPFMFWVRKGYNSDLSQYYKNVYSAGVALELRTFE